MTKRFYSFIIKKLNLINAKRNQKRLDIERHEFLNSGKIPWSTGYNAYKWELIEDSINDHNLLDQIKEQNLPYDYGHRVDERVVEYPWIFANLYNSGEKLLDAGSTFNYKSIIQHSVIKRKELTIFTFAPEINAFTDRGVSYVYGDLRKMPFKDLWFDTVVSQSTIEHIDMDNSIYGYNIDHNSDETKKSYKYLDAINEMLRVLNKGGLLLLTFPYGKFENHGFFQQFDEEMLNRILELLKVEGVFECTYYKYNKSGWEVSGKEDLVNIESYNPHTGKGKRDDYAAHCRSIVCINFLKNK